MNQPDQAEQVLACYFDRPVIEAVRRYATSDEWKEIGKWLPSKPGLALDVGAGNGLVSYALAKSGWKAVALEPDPSRFVGAGAIREIAKQESLSIDVVETWGESIPFAENHFDLVMARQVVHHARDLNQLYAEMARVLRPGGTLLAFRDHVIDTPNDLLVFQNIHPLHHLYGGVYAYTLAQYRAAIQLAGLNIVRQWKQFDSVINYAPLTRLGICQKIGEKCPVRPMQSMIAKTLQTSVVFPILMKTASLFNRKPGRFVSFLLMKS